MAFLFVFFFVLSQHSWTSNIPIITTRTDQRERERVLLLLFTSSITSCWCRCRSACVALLGVNHFFSAQVTVVLRLFFSFLRLFEIVPMISTCCFLISQHSPPHPPPLHCILWKFYTFTRFSRYYVLHAENRRVWQREPVARARGGRKIRSNTKDHRYINTREERDST